MDFSITNLMEKGKNKLKSATKFLNSNEVLLNNMVLEIVSEFNHDLSADIPVTKLDDGTKKTDNIFNNPDTFSIKVQLLGIDKDKNYEKILNIVNKREPVELFVDKLYTNLGISSLSRTMTTYNCIELNISFIQMEFAYIDFIPAPTPKAKPIVSAKSEIKTSKRDWEGGLASESIKLKGV